MATTTVTIPSEKLAQFEMPHTKDENPVPTVCKPTNPFHESDAIVQYSPKSTSKSGHREKYGNAKSEFISLVEVCQVERYAREITRFERTHQKSRDDKLHKILDEAHKSHDLKQ